VISDLALDVRQDASNRDAALAHLSSLHVMAHLSATCQRADYDAAMRVLGDCDRPEELGRTGARTTRPRGCSAMKEFSESILVYKLPTAANNRHRLGR